MLKRLGLRVAQFLSNGVARATLAPQTPAPPMVLGSVSTGVARATLAPETPAPQTLAARTSAPLTPWTGLSESEAIQIMDIIDEIDQIMGELLCDTKVAKPSKKRKVIRVVGDVLRKKGYTVKDPVADFYPVFANQTGKFLCDTTAFFFLGNFAGAMVIFRPFVNIDTIVEVKKNADMIISESYIVSVEMYVGGDSFDEEARALAKNYYIQLIENVGEDYQIVC